MNKEKSCLFCFHKDVCYAMGRMPERAETCSKYAPDVKVIKYGKWIENLKICHSPYCSLCGAIGNKSNYCSHCGADMTKKED